MIFHIARNEKFLGYAIAQAENAFPGQNVFLFLARPGEIQPAILPCPSAQWHSITGPAKLTHFVNSLLDAKLIVTHSLDPLMARILTELQHVCRKSARKNPPILWIFWGAEVYNRLPEHQQWIYAPETWQTFASKSRNRWRETIWWGKSVASRFLGDKATKLFNDCPSSPSGIRKAMDIPNSMGCFMEEDFQVLHDRSGLRNHRLWYIYFSIEDTVGADLKDTPIQGNGILLGNSCTPENNHLEALTKLSHFDLQERTVHIPMSYGDAVYRSFLLQIAPKRIGNGKFSPLLDFLSRDQYNRILLGCPVIIMNHYRQQAVGNCLTALWMGARLYMSEKSPAYQYYKRLGLHLFTVEADLQPNNPDALQPLSQDQTQHNRSILLQHFSREAVMRQTRESLQKAAHIL